MEELYKSVTDYPNPIQAEVSGTIPKWLKGDFYRNGPGKFEFGDTKYNHWFDGMALIHRFNIEDGKVEYRSKFLESDTYKKNTKANRIVVGEFGTGAFPDPCKNIFRRFFSYFTLPEGTDNCLVNCYSIGESLYSATETQYIRKIDPKTLDTLDKVDLEKLVSVNGATAHPHVDSDGCVHNLGSVHKKGFKHAIIKITPPKVEGNSKVAEKAEIVATVEAKNKLNPSYCHSFAMTENYYIITESPLFLNILKIIKNSMLRKPMTDSMNWDPKTLARLHVVDKRTGNIVNPSYGYYMKAFFAFHHIGAYEEDGHIVIDAPCIDDAEGVMNLDMELLKNLKGEPIPGVTKPSVRRIVIPLDLETKKEGNLVSLPGTTATAKMTGPAEITLEYELLTPFEFDFAQINYKKYNTKKYRYIYGVGWNKKQMDSLVKFDLETRETKLWYTEGHFPSEPIFVESPEPTSEDDGLLLSVVLTIGENRHAYLLVLDAKTWEEKARAVVDVKIGIGFHSYFR